MRARCRARSVVERWPRPDRRRPLARLSAWRMTTRSQQLGETGRALEADECAELARAAGGADRPRRARPHGLRLGAPALADAALGGLAEHLVGGARHRLPRPRRLVRRRPRAGGRGRERGAHGRRPAAGRWFGAGEGFSFTGSGIHRMDHAAGAVTIHVYSPPIQSIGHYELVDGELRRTPVPAGRGVSAEPRADRLARRPLGVAQDASERLAERALVDRDAEPGAGGHAERARRRRGHAGRVRHGHPRVEVDRVQARARRGSRARRAPSRPSRCRCRRCPRPSRAARARRRRRAAAPRA